MKTKESGWYGRNLQNYKETYLHLAKEKGKEHEFSQARTLTQARKILWGTKSKRFTCCTKGCYQCRGQNSL